LWTVEPDTGGTQPITDESFRIFDFDASRDGEFVIFSAFNDQQGLDLYRVDRLGNNPDFLLECGPDRCSAPAISPDGKTVAYVREAAGPSSALQFGAPRIWILNLETKQDAPLYEDQQIIGYGPVWSPDGTRLSSYDALADELRLLDFVTGDQFIVPSQTGNPVSWSADGNTLAFTDVATNDSGPYTRIREANISTQEITTLFGENDERDYRYNALAWSPIEDKLIIGLQLAQEKPAKSLLFMDPATRDGQVIADHPDYIYNNPRWDPWGRALIFQQLKLKGEYEAEIGLWEPGLEEPRLLVKGLLAHGLP
jgi:Tol biopolymer transport system component